MTVTIADPKKFLHKFAILQRKAARLGLTVPKATPVGSPYTKIQTFRYQSGGGESETYLIERTVQDFEVDAKPFCVEGWSLLGKVERVGDRAVVIKCRKSDTDVSRHEGMGFHCEHCRTKRDRKNVFVIEHTDNHRTMQVGKSCLSDFFPAYPGNVASQFSFEEEVFSLVDDSTWSDEPSFGGGGPSGERAFSVPDMLASCVAVIRKHGYVSRTKAQEVGGEPTSDLFQRLFKAREIDCTPDDVRKAEEILAWFDRNKDLSNDFHRTLDAYIAHGMIPLKRIGVLLALPNSKDRADAKAIREAKAAVSQFVGEVGQRLTFRATVQNVTGFEGSFGWCTITTLLTEDGNFLKYWNSINGSNRSAAIGDHVEFSAGVKKHERDSYLNADVTVLTRATKVKFLKIKDLTKIP